ncbi:hypothetical protein FRX31_026019 [Thalictrum thalictroides]|uniref:Uncharacterized protein n=1 Tax=Thalictrum thalictroides TaxID=46969 RepID=A0A7J6VH11_THATH|nr:hypothetical protein FRX31_026019 [Thalictrum thalictroides]
MTELTGRDEHGAENSITDDIYYQVMPPDRHRRVRQQGRGVTPSSSNHNGAALRIEQLENELAEMRRQTQEKEEQRKQEFDQLTRSFEVQIEKMQRNFDEQSKTMEERILQTLIQRTANLHHIGQITVSIHFKTFVY